MSLTGPRPAEKQSQGERNVGIPPGSGSDFTPGLGLELYAPILANVLGGNCGSDKFKEFM